MRFERLSRIEAAALRFLKILIIYWIPMTLHAQTVDSSLDFLGEIASLDDIANIENLREIGLEVEKDSTENPDIPRYIFGARAVPLVLRISRDIFPLLGDQMHGAMSTSVPGKPRITFFGQVDVSKVCITKKDFGKKFDWKYFEPKFTTGPNFQVSYVRRKFDDNEIYFSVQFEAECLKVFSFHQNMLRG